MVASDNTVQNDGLWVWPVPDMLTDGKPPRPSTLYYPAEQSQEFRRPSHLGVDLMYRRLDARDMVQEFPPGGHDGTERWFAPPGTPIVAARDGVLWSAGMSPRGISVVLDHGHPNTLGKHGYSTFYQHLASTIFPTTKGGHTVDGNRVITVKAGDVIGTMGYDPLDASKLRHLHFAVWKDGAGDAASVDPERAMRDWKRSTWNYTRSNA